MREDLSKRVNQRKREFAQLTGTQVGSFFCPILHVDEDVELCRGHVVNQAFSQSDKTWVVQRQDVDSFYGSYFEADFIHIEQKEEETPFTALLDKERGRVLDARLFANGKEIPHYFTAGRMPEGFTGIRLESDDKTLFMGLNVDSAELRNLSEAKLEVRLDGDLRLSALVALLKAGYLTLFSFLGYRYALSFDGWLMGPLLLGRFFLENRGKSKSVIQVNAKEHFTLAAHLVRPALEYPADFEGTVSDRKMLLCMGEGGIPWAIIVFVRASKQMNAVMLPFTESAEAKGLFASFLENEVTEFTATRIVFRGDHWDSSSKPVTIVWPKDHNPFGE